MSSTTAAPSATTPRLTRRQWAIRVGGLLTVLAAGAIIAGVLVSKEQEDKRRTPGVALRPDTVVQSVAGGPDPVTAVNKPLIDANYPYQLTGKLNEAPLPPASALPDFSSVVAGSQSGGAATGDKQSVPPDSSFFGAVTALGWQAIGGGSPAICYPKDGKEVVAFSSASSDCVIIVLTRSNSNPYNIRDTMNITTVKVFVGNPVNVPVLQPGKIERVFNVLPGGSLDLRSVLVYRAPGRKIKITRRRAGRDLQEVDLFETRLLVGSIALIWPGGNFHAVASTFATSGSTFNNTISEIEDSMRGQMNRALGGSILMLGGILRIDGCVFLSSRPFGSWVSNSITVGRDILILVGQATILGTHVINVNGMTGGVTVGNLAAVLGGNVIWMGGGVVSVNGVQAQYGAGMQVFVGGGCFIAGGFTFSTVAGALHRAGFGQLGVGGGVLVIVGYLQARVWGVATVNNFGQSFAVGAGIKHLIGGGIGSCANVFMFSGNGGTSAISSGNAMWLGIPGGRPTLIQAQFGLGLVHSLGNGDFKNYLNPEGTVQLARIQVCLGTVVYVGAGLAQFVNVSRFTVQLVNAFYGSGNIIYVGAGGIFSTISKTFSIRLFEDRSLNANIDNPKGAAINSAYTVGFSGATSGTVSGANQQRTIFMTNGKLFTFGRRRRQLDDAAVTDQEQKKELPSNFIAVVGDQFTSYNITGVKKPQERAKASTSFNGLGDFWEGTGFNFASFDDIAKSYQARLTEQLQLTKLSAEYVQSQNQINVKHTDKANCLLANIKPSGESGTAGYLDISPEGKESCHALDFPTSVSNPQEAYVEAAAKAPGFEDHYTTFGTHDFSNGLPATDLHQFRVTVNCADNDPTKDSGLITSGCASSDSVKWAILDLLDLPSNTPLAVAGFSVPTSIVDHLLNFEGFDATSSHGPQGDYNPDCAGHTTYDGYFVTQNSLLAKTLKEGVQTLVDDPARLKNALVDSTPEDSTTSVCGASVSVTGSLNIPASNQPAWRPSAGTSLGASVSIGDGVSPVPPTKLIVGDEYSIFLSNFPDKTDVVVKLIKGTAVDGPIVAKVDSLRDKGYGEVKWTATKEQVGAYTSADRYYLYAFSKQLPALFSNSQPFTFRTEEELARRRR